MTRLTWGLLVATYNRPEMLRRMLRLAVEQSRPPAQVIIVDASPDWEDSKAQVMARLGSEYANIEWIYEAATVPALTAQRNQALRHLNADVAFLFDDDTLMYPGCAEAMMQVYEADVEGAVVGVTAETARYPPDRARNHSGSVLLASDSFKYRVWKRLVGDRSIEKTWIPYDGRFAHHIVPGHVMDLVLRSTPLFNGYRMTFRRSVFEHEVFDEMLPRYAACEDKDFSNRANRLGVMLVARHAFLHHAQAPGGRLSIYRASLMSTVNDVALHAVHSTAKDLSRKAWWLRLRSLPSRLLLDLWTRQLSIPRTRGCVTGLRLSRELTRLPKSEVAGRYYALHEYLVGQIGR